MTLAAPRTDAIDALRGLALLGIAMVNVQMLGISVAGLTPASVAAPWDAAAAFGVAWLLQAKCYPLFAFLFGYGLQHQLLGPPQRVRRRLAALAVLGLAHAVLLFAGDVLLLYALVGTALLPQAATSDAALRRRTLRWAAFVLLAWLGLALADGLYPLRESPDSLARQAALDVLLGEPGAWPGVVARLQQLPEALFNGLLVGGQLLLLFHLGLWAARRRLLVEPQRHARLLRIALRAGLGIGLPLNALAAWYWLAPLHAGGTPSVAALALVTLAGTLLAAGYLAALLAVQARWPALLRAVQPAGRLSLSVYLGESLLMAAVFAGWGLQAYGRWGAAAATAVAAAAWAVLALAAALWLRRGGRRGPAEWLLQRMMLRKE